MHELLDKWIVKMGITLAVVPAAVIGIAGGFYLAVLLFSTR